MCVLNDLVINTVSLKSLVMTESSIINLVILGVTTMMRATRHTTMDGKNKNRCLRAI